MTISPLHTLINTIHYVRARYLVIPFHLIRRLFRKTKRELATSSDSSSAVPTPRQKLPLLGHALSFVDMRRIVHVFMQWFDECGDLYQISVLNRRLVVTANPDDCYQVLGQTNSFSRTKGQVEIFDYLQQGNLQTESREHHKLHRAAMRKGLDKSMLSKTSRVVSIAAQGLVDHLLQQSIETPGSPIDITPVHADTTSRVLFEAVLGQVTTRSYRSDFSETSKAFLRELFWEIIYYPLGQLRDRFGYRQKLLDTHRKLQGISKDILENRKPQMSVASEQATYPRNLLDIIAQIDFATKPATKPAIRSQPTPLRRPASRVSRNVWVL